MRMAMVAVLAVGLPVMAQEPVLKGPTVSVPAARTTLVEHDFNGKLKRLDAPPEEAALALMGLDDATKGRTDKIFAERAAVLDRAVVQNLELIVQIQNAVQSGDKAEALGHFREFAKALEPLRERGKLVDEVKAALPEEKREGYAAMVREYHEAAIRETMASAKGEKLTLREAAGREYLEAVGREIKRSYERAISSRTADFEKLLVVLELRPEQEMRVRNMVTDFAQLTMGNPTAAQKKDIFWKVHKELDRDQRRALLSYYLGK